MIKPAILLASAALLSSAALAAESPAPGPSLTFSAEEAGKMLADLNNATLFVKQANGALQPFVEPGAAAVASMIQDKMRTALEAENKAKAAKPAPVPAEPPK